MIVANRKQKRKEAKAKSKKIGLGIKSKIVRKPLPVEQIRRKFEMVQSPEERLLVIHDALSALLSRVSASMQEDPNIVFSKLVEYDRDWRKLTEKLPNLKGDLRIGEYAFRETLAQTIIDWETEEIDEDRDPEQFSQIFGKLGWDFYNSLYPNQDENTQLVFMDFGYGNE